MTIDTGEAPMKIEKPAPTCMVSLKRWISPFIGIISVGASACVFGFSNVIVQWLTGVDPFTIALFRFIGIFFLSIPGVSVGYLKEKKSPFPRGRRLALLGRSLAGSACLIIHFYALKHLPMADVNLLSATAPAFTVFSARIFLKEPISKLDIFNVVTILVGVTLIVKPPFIFGDVEIYQNDPEAWIAVTVVLIGSIFIMSNSYTLIRYLRDLPLTTVLLNFGLVGMIISGGTSYFLGCQCIPTDAISWILLFIVGLVGFLSQIGISFAARFESAATISLLREAFELLFAFLFQILFFQKIPDLLTVVGAFIIVSSIFSSSFRNWMKTLSEDHWIKELLRMKDKTIGDPEAQKDSKNSGTKILDQKSGTGILDQKPGTEILDQKPGTEISDQKTGTEILDQKSATENSDQKSGTENSDHKFGTETA